MTVRKCVLIGMAVISLEVGLYEVAARAAEFSKAGRPPDGGLGFFCVEGGNPAPHGHEKEAEIPVRPAVAIAASGSPSGIGTRLI